MEPQIKLSVIIPLFNESKIIDQLVTRVETSVKKITENYEVIFIDDGSTDTTFTTLKDRTSHDDRLKHLSFSRNFGHQIAVMAGLDHCKGAAVVIIDGDLQDPPELIPQLYDKYMEGNHVVYARRISRKGETWFKKITAKLFYRLMNRITEINIPLDTGDFRLIDRKIVENLKAMPEPNKFLRGQIAWMGYKQSYIEFARDERSAGKTGYSLGKMIRFALDGITGFSNAPLRFVTNAGLLVSGIAFLVIIYALVSHFALNQTITGWTSLIISMMFIGGIQLIAIGIIGAYISRINNTVRKRPLYFIEQASEDFKV